MTRKRIFQIPYYGGKKMKIRKAILEDENSVIHLLKQFPPEEVTVDWRDGARTFRQIVKNSELGSVLVAEEDGEILGVITISYPTAIRCGGIYSNIEEFIVSEKARGKGVGGGLVKAIMDESIARGCYEIQINNPSKLGYPVYIRAGLKDIGKHLKLELPHNK
jgi:predicted N-acetyltransferase YhbS